MNLSTQIIFSFFIFVIISVSVQAQEDLYSKNQVEFNVFYGGSVVQFDHQNGFNQMKNQITPLFGARLQYNRKLNKRLQINGALGFGSHGFTYALPEVATPDVSSERMSFFNSFQEVYLGAKYTIPLKNNFQFGLSLGGGIANFSGDVVGVYEDNESSGNSGYNELARIEYSLNPNPVPFLELGPQLSKTLKNQNEVSLKLSYIQSFSAIYEGVYQVFGNSSNGMLRNSGSNFRFTLGYTFTGDQRIEKIARFNTELNDFKAAKTEYKKNKRFIHPKSIFVSLTTGIGAMKSYAEDPNGFIRDSYGQSISTRLMVEKGLKNNFFLEAGYQFIEYYGSLKFKDLSMTTSSNDFFTHQLNMGAGYRVIGKKKNYHYFNIHSGLSIGFIPEKKGATATGGGSMSFGTITDYYELSYSYETEILSSVLIAPYIGLSKDFCLSERLFITLMYRYQYGLNKLSQRSITYQNNEQYPTPQNASNFTNGTEQTFQLGLKLKLGGE
jgi:hypothetical protein